MNFKRKFLFPAFIISISAFFYSFKQPHKIAFNFSALIYKSEGINDPNHLFIKTILINTSSDTITYVTMSCSYCDEYRTDTKNLKFFLHDCAKNIPEFIKIPPQHQFGRIIEMEAEKNVEQLKGASFRMGVYVLTTNDIDAEYIRSRNDTSFMKASIAKANSDINRQRFVFFTPGKHIFSVHDTVFKTNINFTTIRPDGSISQADKLENVRLFWSNTITL